MKNSCCFVNRVCLWKISRDWLWFCKSSLFFEKCHSIGKFMWLCKLSLHLENIALVVCDFSTLNLKNIAGFNRWLYICTWKYHGIYLWLCKSSFHFKNVMGLICDFVNRVLISKMSLAWSVTFVNRVYISTKLMLWVL